jgi:hypothetical protein
MPLCGHSPPAIPSAQSGGFLPFQICAAHDTHGLTAVMYFDAYALLKIIDRMPQAALAA